MASLSNPTFQIDILTGMPNDYRVSGTVNVELSPFEMFLVNSGLPLQLQSNLWGNDSAFYDGNSSSSDDQLFSFTSQSITAPGTYTFDAIVPRGVLNEDRLLLNWGNLPDEVYNKFSLVSGTNLFPLNISTNSPTITGLF
jgi:hypothetical protein